LAEFVEISNFASRSNPQKKPLPSDEKIKNFFIFKNLSTFGDNSGRSDRQGQWVRE